MRLSSHESKRDMNDVNESEIGLDNNNVVEFSTIIHDIFTAPHFACVQAAIRFSIFHPLQTLISFIHIRLNTPTFIVVCI